MELDIQTWVSVSACFGGGLAMGLGAIGAAIGEGNAALCANAAVSRNPESSAEIFKGMLVGQAVAESASIFALVVAMILLFTKFPPSILGICATVSAGLCMGFGAIGAGIGSGLPAGAACTAVGRQPAISGKVTTNMLIGSAVCQTPAIFSLVTAFILLFTNFSNSPVSPTWAAILGAGIASGLGAIGSGLGGGFVAESSCLGMARQPTTAGTVTNTMLLGQAVTQTTAIYGLLVSFILMFKTYDPTNLLAPASALLASGLCMGIGAIGPGLGEGYIASSAVDGIARNESATAELVRVMLVGQAVAESTGIYSLVIALVLIFVI